MPFLERSFAPWSWFKDDWLVSRRATVMFFVAVILVLAVTPLFLGSVEDPAQMPLGGRVFWTILGMLGPIGLFFLWFGMWRYWVRLDRSRVYVKRLWFVILIIGFWYGSCLYYFFVYYPQVSRRARLES